MPVGHHDRPASRLSKGHCGCANALFGSPVRDKDLTCQMTEKNPLSDSPIGRVSSATMRARSGAAANEILETPDGSPDSLPPSGRTRVAADRLGHCASRSATGAVGRQGISSTFHMRSVQSTSRRRLYGVGGIGRLTLLCAPRRSRLRCFHRGRRRNDADLGVGVQMRQRLSSLGAFK